jgi:protein TonB
MELKKNPKKDLNQSSKMFFTAGLAMVLALSYLALEWKTFYSEPHIDVSQNVFDELEEPVELFTVELPPPPKPIVPDVIEIIDNEVDIPESPIETTESNEEIEVYEVEEIEVAEIDEEVEVIWTNIEEVPVFPGCEKESDKRACFNTMMQKHINKTFRYPEIALQMGTEGKVFTQFTIEKDGTIGSILLRGPDKNLEKEAKRIIGKLPKMKPGKQRDQNVKVAFSIPIIFQLN